MHNQKHTAVGMTVVWQDGSASVVSGLKAFKDSLFIPLPSEKGKVLATADAKYVSDNPAS